MLITIKTENGHMTVELDQFFPTTVTRVRKLFRLMRQGLPEQEKAAVRDYLDTRKRQAAVDHRELKRLIGDLELQRRQTEMQLRGLKGRITEAKGGVRAAESIEKNSEQWIREFDTIVRE